MFILQVTGFLAMLKAAGLLGESRHSDGLTAKIRTLEA
jgi:hypothetical protein